MIAAVATTVAGCLALLMAFVVGLVGARPADAAGTKYTIKDLGTLPGSAKSYAHGVNDSGQVVGYAGTENGEGEIHAFLYSDGQMQDLSTLLPGGRNSIATGINNSGQVVGHAGIDGPPRASWYSGGQIQDLGTLPDGGGSFAWGVNDSGRVVGVSEDREGWGRHAFVYSNGQMQDLNDQIPADSGWHLLEARAINTSGQIVGTGVELNGDEFQTRAFLATPVPDTVKPQITIITPPQDATYTLGEAVTASYTCADEDSGVASCEGTVADGANIDTSSTGTKTFTVNATDNAGNTNSVSHTYTVNPDPNDSTPPTVECADPDGTWHATDVSIDCTASDSGSGLADPGDASFSLSTDVAPETENSDAPTGTRKICDVAGNCADAGPIRGNKVDKQAPDITISTPADSDKYSFGQAVAADYACADGGSDVASCVGTVLSGNSIDTSSLGTKAFKVDATDNVGNQSSRSVGYEVTYPFGGFLSPVDKPSTVNVVKSGSAIPVKFSLGDDYGLDIFAEGYPQSGTVPNDPNAPVDNIEVIVSAGSSGLSYDASTGQYTYVWKSTKEWVGTSRRLVLKLEDGTEHTALFKFTR
jgi:probable HAF family extracellular repeat protein